MRSSRPVFTPDEKFWKSLEEALPGRLRTLRWFGGKSRILRSVKVIDRIPVAGEYVLAVIEVTYADGPSDRWALPLAWVRGRATGRWIREKSRYVLLKDWCADRREPVLCVDAVHMRKFRSGLLDILRGTEARGPGGVLQARRTRAFERVMKKSGKSPVSSRLLRAEQSNTSINYSGRSVLKLYRRLQPGINPDVEIGLHLTEAAEFGNTPPCLGTIEYRNPEGAEIMTVAFLTRFVRNRGDAWTSLQRDLEKFQNRRGWTSRFSEIRDLKCPLRLEAVLREPIPGPVRKFFGSFLGQSELLGRRTFELHQALAGREADIHAGSSLFEPSEFTEEYRTALHAGLLTQSENTLEAFRGTLRSLPAGLQEAGGRLLHCREEVARRYSAVLTIPWDSRRIRIHGDFHLGQVLVAKGDFQIIDFEGEPARPIEERRQMHSALRDVAGMLRSFHYAATVALKNRRNAPLLDCWHGWMRAAFLRGYLSGHGSVVFLPRDPATVEALLNIFVLEKAFYELHYEMNNRPDWVGVPLHGILRILEETP